MRTAWIYPGHGSQYPGMGRGVLAGSRSANELLAAAEEACGRPLRRAMLEGPTELLGRPIVLEPALAALALAHTALLEENGFRPDCVAGYSAGEVAALHAAGVLTREGALRLAAIRGRVLEDFARAPDVRMAALYGLAGDEVDGIVRELAPAGQIYVAGWNSADHTTVVGAAALVVEAERRARGKGAVTAVVPVSGAWHSPLVADATRRIREETAEIEFRVPRIPLFLGVSGRVEFDPERIRHLAERQISEPVQWRRVTEGMVRLGVTRFVELGPAGVLSSYLRRASLRGGLEVRCLERRNGALLPLDRLRAPRPALARMEPLPSPT